MLWPTSGHNVADQALVARMIFARDDTGLSNRGMAEQDRFNLAGLNAEAPDLDLLVGTAQKIKHPLCAPPGQVAGPIHASSRRSVGIGHEALGA